ncbi:MAG: F420-non-reducing hydrogenase vhu subunit A [Candidatus Thorarchaeota archaeon]|nr:MAG: F420-non-reducing hydrogenase vhu subunit A [Candidatus Thorarchaeota archaeon]
MTDEKTIKIHPVTRLEGHGELTVKMTKDGKVKDVQFNVSSTRFFEKFLEGRFAEEAPRVAPRICGICPVPHHLASVKAVEDAWKVTPPPAAIKLRRLAINAKQYSSHALHFFALAAPDFVVGPFADPAKRNVATIIKELPDVGKLALQVMKFGQDLVTAVGGKAIHPVTATPGGMLNPFSEEKRDIFLERVKEAKDWTLQTVDLAKKVVTDYWDPITKLAIAPTYYVGLHDKGNLEIYEGKLRVMNPEGEIVEDFTPRSYKKYMGEYVSDHSYATHIYYKPVGYPEGIWRANSLARCNVVDKMATPLADEALQEMRDKLGRVIHATFAYHWARIIELVQAIEEIEMLLEDPEIVSTDVKLSDVEPRKGQGVGCVEAPRGTLIHNYWTDDDGLITKVNMLVATNHNIAGIEKSLMVAAKQVFEEKAHEGLKLPDPMIE